jgi:undecaprenyl diphosphate synthase
MHVGIIMDGSGRWAERRGLDRGAGHEAGAAAVDATMLAAPGCGIGCLTLFAFSSANWRRPTAEVAGLMRIFRRFFDRAAATHRARGVRVTAIGRRDRLPRGLVSAIERAERATRHSQRLLVRVALDYSSRASIIEVASERLAGASAAAGARPQTTAIGLADDTETGDVDLIIRTGGEHRLSDFLLWESAFAELVFLDCLWPDFTPDDLAEAIAEFRRRHRRFGGVGHRRLARAAAESRS